MQQLTEGRGVDLVVETVGGANLGRALKTLVQGGRIGVIGILDGIEMSAVFHDQVRLRGKIIGIGVGSQAGLETLVWAVDVNGFAPMIAGEYDARDVPAAFEHLARVAFGKMVVRFS